MTSSMPSLQRQRLQAWAFRGASKLLGRLQGVLTGVLPPAVRLLQIGSAFWQSRALAVAAQLDLATHLGEERLTHAELAERAGIRPDLCLRLLRFLAAMGVFSLGADGRVSNNPVSQALRSDRPGSVRHVVLMHNSPEMTQPWLDALEESLHTGVVPFEQVHAEPLFAYMDSHPEFDALFARAMDEVGALSGEAFVTALDWGRFDRLIDLGGGKGAKSAAILRGHPGLKAIVMDRAPVIAQARRWWQEPERQLLAARVEFEAGDLLSDALPEARSPQDVYLLSAVLHGCDDSEAATLLGRVRAAVGRSGATVVLMEVVMPDHEADLATTGFDMQMLMGTRGRERTAAEWRALVRQSGFDWIETVQMASIGALLVLRGQP